MLDESSVGWQDCIIVRANEILMVLNAAEKLDTMDRWISALAEFLFWTSWASGWFEVGTCEDFTSSNVAKDHDADVSAESSDEMEV